MKEENKGQANWNYTSEEESAPLANTGDAKTLSWSAPSSYGGKRGVSWYSVMLIATVVVCGGFYLIFKDIITALVILLCVVLVVVYGLKKPRKINYQLEEGKIRINNKDYLLSGYRSFYVNRRPNGSSASLTPLKRLMPAITINFGPEIEASVLSSLGNYLPMEERENDLFDKFLDFIGF